MSAPNTITFSGELLEKAKNEGAFTKEQLDFLRSEADKKLNDPTVYAVIYRNATPVTKNKHEYASIGPYWWPNPDTPDGLPYVRRDGEVNPDYQEKVGYAVMTSAVFTLSLAAYIFEERKYAKKAEKLIYDWYLNPETYMEPHVEYGQAIPGICDGRGIGIIEFISSHAVFNGVALLESLGYISEITVKALKAWFVKLVDWMITSETGLDEDIQLNNHGTIYDANVLASAIFTGREFLADKICKTAYKRRFLDQVRPDGSQPLELARTRAMSYTLVNTQGLMLIANMAYRRGYTHFWEKDPERGECIIKSAIDYIYPYVMNPETFPYQEMNPPGAINDMAHVLLTYATRFDDADYEKKARELMTDIRLWHLVPLI